MESKKQTLSPGTRLGEFEVIELLSVGGMGVVYLAKDTRLERQVAIKILPREFVKHPAAQPCFQAGGFQCQSGGSSLDEEGRLLACEV